MAKLPASTRSEPDELPVDFERPLAITRNTCTPEVEPQSIVLPHPIAQGTQPNDDRVHLRVLCEAPVHESSLEKSGCIHRVNRERAVEVLERFLALTVAKEQILPFNELSLPFERPNVLDASMRPPELSVVRRVQQSRDGAEHLSP